MRAIEVALGLLCDDLVDYSSNVQQHYCVDFHPRLTLILASSAASSFRPIAWSICARNKWGLYQLGAKAIASPAFASPRVRSAAATASTED